MLFAENVPDAATLGPWMQNFFYVIGAICAVAVTVTNVLAAMRRRQSSPDSEYVTRGELSREISRVNADSKAFQNEIRAQSAEQSRRLYAVDLRLVWMSGLLTQICDKQGISASAQPAIRSVDEP